MTNVQIAILNNAINHPGSTRETIIDSYYTRNGHFSLANAYARVKRCERHGWLEDRSETPHCRSEMYITDAGKRALCAA